MTYTVTAEKMVFGGDCLAHINGKNVFIPFAIPGEELEVEITKSMRDFDRAKIVRIKKPSVHRTEPFCPLYGKCGGCNMQHIKSDYQKELRISMLRDCFEREGISVGEIEVISGNDTGYRSRIQLHDGGFFEKETNSLVPLDHCPVATAEINEWLKATPIKDRPKGRVHIFGDSRVTTDTPHKVLIAEEKQIQQKKIVGKTKKKIKNAVPHRFQGTVFNTSNLCSVLINGKTIQFDVQGFFQSNLTVLEKSIDAVLKNMAGSSVLDMYAGCGTFSVFLTDHFKNTTLVEHNRDALVFAEMNLNGTSHESYGVSGEAFVKNNIPVIESKNGSYDAVVIDPPRSGMEKSVRDYLCTHKTHQIKSISCDPATHARDVKALVSSGYTLTKLYLLDFYPQTAHIESLAFIENMD